ncbi:hypothetical protein B0H66DRAFT_538712 [Apodospora peruviana]|uniref:Uncharacterized protein n=1 Tax=Apodospora peruviana TaxID=516989 RepID=A0AAE0LZB3_9PEZI|nr:hypothetical protein B0H66DRAFT_538712 [Apodospora peruviana]
MADQNTTGRTEDEPQATQSSPLPTISISCELVPAPTPPNSLQIPRLDNKRKHPSDAVGDPATTLPDSNNKRKHTSEAVGNPGPARLNSLEILRLGDRTPSQPFTYHLETIHCSSNYQVLDGQTTSLWTARAAVFWYYGTDCELPGKGWRCRLNDLYYKDEVSRESGNPLNVNQECYSRIIDVVLIRSRSRMDGTPRPHPSALGHIKEPIAFWVRFSLYCTNRKWLERLPRQSLSNYIRLKTAVLSFGVRCDSTNKLDLYYAKFFKQSRPDFEPWLKDQFQIGLLVPVPSLPLGDDVSVLLQVAEPSARRFAEALIDAYVAHSSELGDPRREEIQKFREHLRSARHNPYGSPTTMSQRRYLPTYL